MIKKLVELKKLHNDDLIIVDGVNLLATHPKIGYLQYHLDHETETEMWSSIHYRELTQQDIDDILQNNGKCYLTLETFEGDGCGFRQPKLKEGKFILQKIEKN
jgi:hypothetical protein